MSAEHHRVFCVSELSVPSPLPQLAINTSNILEDKNVHPFNDHYVDHIHSSYASRITGSFSFIYPAMYRLVLTKLTEMVAV